MRKLCFSLNNEKSVSARKADKDGPKPDKNFLTQTNGFYSKQRVFGSTEHKYHPRFFPLQKWIIKNMTTSVYHENCCLARGKYGSEKENFFEKKVHFLSMRHIAQRVWESELPRLYFCLKGYKREMHIYKSPRPCLLKVLFNSEESELQIWKVFGEVFTRVKSVTPLFESQ